MKAGSGALTFGVPTSPGVPAGLAEHTLTLSFNDAAGVRDAFARFGDRIAAVIVEPIAGNMNCVPPVAGFLESLRECCDGHGAVLIFDEVMTGFRVAPGGAQALYGVRPDLTILGKVIGGGMPVGAFGGRGEIMDHIAPDGPVYQAGTLSGNPIAMTAGLTTLELIAEDGFPRSTVGDDVASCRRPARTRGGGRHRDGHEPCLRHVRAVLHRCGRGQRLCRRHGLRHGAIRTILPRHARRRCVPRAVRVRGRVLSPAHTPTNIWMRRSAPRRRRSIQSRRSRRSEPDPMERGREPGRPMCRFCSVDGTDRPRPVRKPPSGPAILAGDNRVRWP